MEERSFPLLTKGDEGGLDGFFKALQCYFTSNSVSLWKITGSGLITYEALANLSSYPITVIPGKQSATRNPRFSSNSGFRLSPE
jgi:hypothetical protein